MSATRTAALLGLLLPTLVLAAEPKDEGRTSITIALQASKANSVELVVKTFVAEGLIVGKSEGGIISSIPVVVKYLGANLGTVTYRATVVGRNDVAAEVQLLALWEATGKPVQPINSTWKKMFVPHWHRVERIAAAVGAATGPSQ
jgi:hypothetical protein